MRLALAGGALAAVLVAGLAAAQSGEGAGNVPTGEARIRGHVLREGAAAAGLEVVLYALPADAEPGLRRTLSDAEGAFAFEGVSNDPEIVYLVGVRVDDVPHGRRLVFSEGQREAEVELSVSQPDPDTSQARRGVTTLRIEVGCGGLVVHESHALHNPTDRVIFVDPSERASRAPILRAELPAAAGPLEAPLGVLPQGFEREDGALRFWGPLYPGSQELEFAYALPAEPGTLSFRRGFPDGADEVLLLLPAGAPAPRGPGLAAAGERELDGRRWQAVRARHLEAGASLNPTLEMPVTPEAVALLETQLWLEVDGAALVVDEQHLFSAGDSGAPAAESGAPLVCFSLPEGAEDLRFSPGAFELGLAPDPSGALALRGPLPPGESGLALRYRVPVAADPVSFAHRAPLRLPLLSIFVADTGLRVETQRLHRRRTARRAERSYLHFEGFEIAAGETVELSLARQPAPRPLPRLASVGFALLAAAAAGAFLLAPLRGRETGQATGESPGERLAAERESVYAAIRDLDEDFETGKLTDEDHAQLRQELRGRAVQLLELERAAPAEAEPEPAPRPSAAAAAHWRYCPACGGELPPAARFCPHCGEPLAGARGAG